MRDAERRCRRSGTLPGRSGWCMTEQAMQMVFQNPYSSFNPKQNIGSALREVGRVHGMTKTGDWQLTVKLKEPSATWKYIFATTAGHIISQAYYNKHQSDFGTASGGLLGTGPFVYQSWTSGQEIVLTKNPNYWDKSAKIDIDKLIFKIIPEDTTRVMGPSGSGKTTLLNLMSGIDRADGGEITIAGTRLSDMSRSERALFRRKKLGMA